MRSVDHLPAPGGYVEIAEERILLGGEAANTANALHQWGHELIVTGNGLGDGRLRNMVQERNLPYHSISIPDPDFIAPICDIYVTPDGERTMFGAGFKNAGDALNLSEIPFKAGEWFTSEPNMELPSRAAVRLAQEAGMKIYLMDFIRPDDPIAPGSFWQCSTDWAGYRSNTQRNVRWVKEFVENHGCFAILSDGPNGFVAGSPELPVRAYPPFPAPEVVDTTGAGDMFRAGMLHGLDQNWPIARCLQFASVAGCLKCKSLGATTSVPTVAEIEAFLALNQDVAGQYWPATSSL